ncbi:hypothetical protein J5226_15680 [Lysobacter sp. K5869]|uniref:hypothetical protein n=1 Tax=Lysobacter sp. K5869 TaxID=2820808 RepID=UPI001C0637C5|nr:hypothetical protein [Lysobacter sp. K5869]QWP75072.1 hypothetical protein J5226_15680 [Lysobacter sp. K5869]
MKRVLSFTLLFIATPVFAADNGSPAAVAAYTRSSLLAFVSDDDASMPSPLIFRATRSSGGTVPDRYEVRMGQPLFVSPTTLYPTWSKGSPSYVFVVLPCAEEPRARAREAPGYLMEFERESQKRPGYYTDVYRAQYQYGQGSEFMVLDIQNSKSNCGVKAYRAKDGKGGPQLVPLRAQEVELKDVFVCEFNVRSCG